MLLFVANPLAAKPAAPAFTTSGAINEAEFLVFDTSPQFLGQSVQAACNEAVATADLATVFPHDMSPRFIGAAAAVAEAVAVSNDCSGVYA